jgi:co-chaperonin GroES (HSP10)
MIKVFEGYVAVKVPVRSQTTESGLYIASNADTEQVISGEIVALHVSAEENHIGQTIYFNRFQTPQIKTRHDGTLFIVKTADILAAEH